MPKSIILLRMALALLASILIVGCSVKPSDKDKLEPEWSYGASAKFVELPALSRSDDGSLNSDPYVLGMAWALDDLAARVAKSSVKGEIQIVSHDITLISPEVFLVTFVFKYQKP